MPNAGFAVIDFETTGFMPGRDRVVEVAVVHVDPDGRITGEWDTLINPQRDLGAQHVHHITAADVMDAPTFDEIVPTLVKLLSGRVIVAHNASFDIRFLKAELERAGYDEEVSTAGLCTMQLARKFLPGSGRSLHDCCAAYDIEIGDAHRASADALATAKLLACYIDDSPMWQGWNEYAAATGGEWPPHEGQNAAWRPRGTTRQDPRTFLQRISVKLPEFAGPAEHLDYLALLDRCLLDRELSAHEANDLVELAEGLGISRTTCERLHAQYFTEVAAVAWSDGVLTTDEIEDLAKVGALLSIPAPMVLSAMVPPVEPIVPPTRAAPFRLEQGDLIVLTGEMQRDRDSWCHELEQRGYKPWPGVTKKVRLVVAADPDSLSGKARKARDYAIPIVSEAALVKLLAESSSVAR